MDNKIIVPLVEKAQAGDKQAYAKLCEEIIREVLYVCIKITGDVHSGEDAAQDTLIQLGHNIKKLRRAQAFPAWLNRCITNSCREHLRKERQRSRLLLEELHEDALETSSEFLPAQWAESQEQRRMILDALQKLPARQQHLLLMYYFQDMSTKEIAAVNKISESAVRSNLQYARGSLKKQIEKAMGTQLSALPAVAAVPTITLILQKDAARLVTEQSAKKVLLAVGSALTGGAATAAGIQIATLAASIAPAAAALVLVAATTLVGSPSPSHPPPDGIGITPQYSDSASMQDGGEGGLYTSESDVPGPVLSAGPSSSSALEQAVEGPSTGDMGGTQGVSISGRVALHDRSGQPVANGADLSGICIQAHQGGTLAAFAHTDAAGNFTLWLPTGTATYEITVLNSALPSLGPQSFAYTLQPGETSLPTVVVQDTAAPGLVLAFYNQTGQRTVAHNPFSAAVEVQDTTECTTEWRLYQYGESAPLLTGEGSSLAIEALGLATGRYTLVFEATDAGGNTAQVQRQLIIQR